MSLNLTTHLAVRRPTLVRVWRTTGQPGSPLTSVWMPALVPDTRTAPQQGGPRL